MLSMKSSALGTASLISLHLSPTAKLGLSSGSVSPNKSVKSTVPTPIPLPTPPLILPSIVPTLRILAVIVGTFNQLALIPWIVSVSFTRS